MLVVEECDRARAAGESKSVTRRAPDLVVKAAPYVDKTLAGLARHREEGPRYVDVRRDVGGGKLHVSSLPARKRTVSEALALGKIDC